jgi:hypothetical protein
MVDEVEERLLAPLDVVEDHDERPFGGDLLELHTDRPKELVGARCAFDKSRNRRLRALSQLLQDADHRPESDPLPVVEAAAVEHRRVQRVAEELAGESRLPDTRRAEDRKQVTAALTHCPFISLTKLLQLGLPADERRVEPP